MDWTESGFDSNLQRTPQLLEATTDVTPLTSPTPFAAGLVSRSVNGGLEIDMQNGHITRLGRRRREFQPNPTATVGSSSANDFGDLQQAIDAVYQDGGGNIELDVGTIKPLSNLIPRNGVNVFGKGKDLSIIDFSNVLSFGDQAAVPFKGTLVHAFSLGNVTTGSNLLSAPLATFLGAGVTAGDSIYINGVVYRVQSVQDDTHLIMTTSYRGASAANLFGEVVRPVRNCSWGRLTLQNGAASGVLLQRVENIDIEEVETVSFLGDRAFAGIKVTSAFNSILSRNIAHNCQRGILIGDILYQVPDKPAVGGGVNPVAIPITLFANQAYSNVADGIRAELASQMIMIANRATANGQAGLFIRMCADSIINQNIANYNTDGIRLYSYDGGLQQSIGGNLQDSNIQGNIANNNSNIGIRVRSSFGSNVASFPISYFVQRLNATGNTASNNGVQDISVDSPNAAETVETS